jgi:dienelactone hydrolase
MRKKYCLFVFIACLLLPVFSGLAQQTSTARRQQYLLQLLPLINPDKPGLPVSFRDKTWTDWQKRTGELPPDFALLPALPLLPDPLVLEEGSNNIPVKTRAQWEQKKAWIRQQAQHWLAGTIPPPPDNLTSRILETRSENGVTIEKVELRFGPGQQAKMTFELLTPPGKGPFPVFMTQGYHRGWAQVALRRGYMACIYAAADRDDDTENYGQVYPDYDFTTLMKRAWGAHRAVDYLYTLARVNKDQLAMAGHSRNGKQALLAAAFDERITAVITSSAGTGGEIPFRYTDESHDNESIDKITTNFPQWLHPRLRFFIGREHKLPIDQNLLMAAIAPRALLLSSATTESQGNPWGIEQSYQSLQRVYQFLGAPDKLGIRLRLGLHGTQARDIEAFLDFLDIQFKRKNLPWQNQLAYNYSFPRWQQLSGETPDPGSYAPVAPAKSLLTDAAGKKIRSARSWAEQQAAIRKNIRWLLGEEPAGVKSMTPEDLGKPGTPDFIAGFLAQPKLKNGKALSLGPYAAPGDFLNGYLYYPTDAAGKTRLRQNGKMPVVIFLHEYAHPNGFSKGIDAYFDDLLAKGFAVYAMDMIGFGTRIEEGTLFYERYPHWSKMGKMVADTRAAIDALQTLEVVDQDNIFLTGYSLGGSIGLFTSALDDRVAGLAVAAAFSPWRTSGPGIEGIHAYAHLHGLLPRLGFFTDQPARIPVDFDEIMAAVAPRPLLVISPTLDRHADHAQVLAALQKVAPVYSFLKAPANFSSRQPEDITRFPAGQQRQVISWLENQVDQAAAVRSAE